jgi:hypothetical protein
MKDPNSAAFIEKETVQEIDNIKKQIKNEEEI